MADSSAIKAGEAFVELGTVNKALKSGLAKGRQMVDKFGKDMTAWGRRMATLGGGIFGAFTLATQQFASTGDELAKMAKRTAFSVESLSRLKLVTQLVGADLKALEVGTRRMAASIMDASFGLETYTRIFDSLGIQVEDLLGKKPEEQFFMIADAMAKITDDTTRAWAAQRLFGRSGTALLPLFELGAEGMALYSQEAERLGITFDAKTAVSAERLVDMFTRLKQATFGVAKAVATQLFGSFDLLLVRLTNLVVNVREFVVANPQLVRNVMNTATALIVMGIALMGVGKSLQIASVLLSPTGLFVTGLLAVLAWGGALDGVIKNWKAFVGDVEIGGRKIASWMEVLAQLWEKMAPVWRAGTELLIQSFQVFLQAIKIGVMRTLQEISIMMIRLFHKIVNSMNEALKAGNLSMIGKRIAGDIRLIAINMRRTATQAAETWDKMLVPERSTMNAMTDRLGTAFKNLKGVTKTQVKEIGALVANVFGGVLGGVFGEAGAAGGVNTISDIFKGLDRQFKEFQREASLSGAGVSGAGVSADVAVAGTFSARAATGLAGMGVFNQQLNAQNQMVNLLSSIDQKTPDDPVAVAG